MLVQDRDGTAQDPVHKAPFAIYSILDR